MLCDDAVRRLHDHWISRVTNTGFIACREVLGTNDVVA